ncbi:AAA family ATPase [Kamptonema formosum]|uniref:AAA family ATPase n=1 Tax=Kamptonema formosum TaxID=331992 RepID=UPI0003452D00|nr:ATP-binding protein [Oscillatoria sp. PCC 10802]
MLKQLILENWKSFGKAVLHIDPLTILTGTNAGGKSNAIEALEFLKRTAQGKEIQACLAGDETLPPIRGGVEGAALRPKTQFTLKVLVQGEDERTDYLYSITVDTSARVKILAESLAVIKQQNKKSSEAGETFLFQRHSRPQNPDLIFLRFNLYDSRVIAFHSSISILSHFQFIQLPGVYLERSLEPGRIVLKKIQEIFILDPAPSKMRFYSRLSESLLQDASNIAGVLAALPEEQKAAVESTLSAYARDLPEGDICRVWAEPVGRLKKDAMLYCEEVWGAGQPPTVVDAREISDGILRFLAILTALLTRPQGSQLVIEDVGSRLHPSRADLLVKMLREIGKKRQVNVLVTTQNPALLDALGPDKIPFVVVAHRDAQTGESKLTLLEDIENLPKLMASSTLGKLAAQGAIEKSLYDIPQFPRES